MGTTLTKEDEKRLKFYYIEKTNPDSCGVSIKYTTNHRYFPFVMVADYKITKIRATEFANVIGVSLGAVQGWIRRGLIKSERIGRARWLDINSVVDFMENDGRITITQVERFADRLGFIYRLMREDMEDDMKKALGAYTTVL